MKLWLSPNSLNRSIQFHFQYSIIYVFVIISFVCTYTLLTEKISQIGEQTSGKLQQITARSDALTTTFALQTTSQNIVLSNSQVGTNLKTTYSYRDGDSNSSQSIACQKPANPIVAENCKPGSPQDWTSQKRLGDIEGFAYPPSINLGDTVRFFINTQASRFNMSMYRSGYYGGVGARLITTITEMEGVVQPACNRQFETGLTSCGNWSATYSLSIPNDWVSGVYFVRLVRPDTGGTGYMIFVVRDDSRKSEILYQQSTSTFRAYNKYQGPSLYDNTARDQCTTVSGTDRAVKVSLMTPYSADVFVNPNMHFLTEFPLVSWLEQQGYDVTYSTSFDTHSSGKSGGYNHLLDHRVFLIAGHDEYWTQEIRDAVTTARDKGVNIAVFSSNTGYWRVRLEPDPWTHEPDSVIVSYKTTQGGPSDPSGFSTSTFRDPNGVNNPENGLVGVQYIGDNDAFYFPLRVTAEQAKDRIYRNTGLQDMPLGSYVELAQNAVGWEWDSVADNGHTPLGLTVLSASPVFGLLLQDAGDYKKAISGLAVVQSIRYITSNGAIVFASGTNNWTRSLGETKNVPNAPILQQVTYNILSDMNSQPKTPTDLLVIDGQTRQVSMPPLPLHTANIGHFPAISDIKSSVDGKQVILSWKTDIPAKVQVWFGTNQDNLIYPSVVSHNDYERSGDIIWNDLDYATQYYFKVVAFDTNWNFGQSPVGTFRTDAPPLRTQIASTVKSGLRITQCWVIYNPAVAISIISIIFVTLVGLGVFIAMRFRRNHTTQFVHALRTSVT